MALPNVLSLNFKVPFVAGKIDFSRAIRGLRGMPRRLLLVGQAGFGVTTGQIMTVTSEQDASVMLGEGSMLWEMWIAAKRNADLGLPIDCYPAPVNTAMPSTRSTSIVTFTTEVYAPIGDPPNLNKLHAGEAVLYVAGKRLSVAISGQEGAINITDAFVAMINADATLPVTAQRTAASSDYDYTEAEMTLTAKWAGNTGNDIDLRSTYYASDVIAKGLYIDIVAMAGGSEDVLIDGLIASMEGYRATEIVLPYTDASIMATIEDELAKRWLANNMQDCMVITAKRGTEGELATWLDTRNSPHVHTICTTNDPTSPWVTAAMAGAVIESMAAIDPATPHTGAALIGYRGPVQGEHFTLDQVNNLLLAGGSPLNIQRDYTGNLLRMVSNYKYNIAGSVDYSMSSVNWLKTASYIRWFNVTEFQTKYMNQGFKIAEYVTDPIPGQKIMTKDLGQQIMLGTYKLLMDAGLTQNMQYYQDSLVIEIDGPNGKLKIQDEPVIITQHYQTEITSSIVAGAV